MNDELKELMEQKKAIERKIRQLKSQTLKNGLAKIDVEHYPTSKPDRHYLAIWYQPPDCERASWRSIFSAKDKKSVIDMIPKIVRDLEELYERAKEDKK